MESGDLGPTAVAADNISFFAANRNGEVGQTAQVGATSAWTLTVLNSPKKGSLFFGDSTWALLSWKVTARTPGAGDEEIKVLQEVQRKKTEINSHFVGGWLGENVLYPALRTMRIDECVQIRLPADTHPEYLEDQELVVEMTLHDYYVVMEAWPDESPKCTVFLSQRVKVSPWKPSSLDVVSVHYRLETADDNEVIYDTRQMGTPHTFTIGAGDVIPGLDMGVMKVAVGQSATIHMAPEAAFGPYTLSKEEERLCQKMGKGGHYMAPDIKQVFDEPEADPLIGRKTTINRDDFFENPRDKDPHFKLIPSSIDMTQYLERYAGRKVTARNVHLEELYATEDASAYDKQVRLDYVDHLQNIAKRYFGIGDFLRAERIYGDAAVVLSECQGSGFDRKSRSLQEARSRCNQALVYTKLGQYDKAESVLKTLLKTQADNAKGCYLMGKVKEAQQEEADAEMWYSRAARIEPGNKEVQKALQRVRTLTRCNSESERQRIASMIAAGRFGDDRPQTQYVKIDKEIDLPVDATVNDNLLNTFGISVEKVDAPVAGEPAVAEEAPVAGEPAEMTGEAGKMEQGSATTDNTPPALDTHPNI